MGEPRFRTRRTLVVLWLAILATPVVLIAGMFLFFVVVVPGGT